jgi:Family of unknown function (DUF6402)
MIFSLAYGKETAVITFQVTKKLKVTKYAIKVYAKDHLTVQEKKHVHTTTQFPVDKDKENEKEIPIDYIFYNSAAKKIVQNGSLPNQIEFTFGILFDDGKESIVSNTCLVHFVKFIPKLLNIKGWVNGENLQKIWFTKGLNSNKKLRAPELDAITWDWIVKESSEVKEEYEEFLNDTKNSLSASNIMFSTNVQNSLIQEIKKMITDGYTSMPTESNPSVAFGTQSNIIIDYKNEKVPIFEKYYFNSKSFSGIWDLGKHYVREGIDDFIAAIANFNYHVFAMGNLKFLKGKVLKDSIEVNVTKLVFYVKDAFDFVDDDTSGPSQPLGYWKISETGTQVNVVKDKPSDIKNNFEVTNKSYRDYRDEHNKGYDFYLYSTLNEVSVNLNFYL